MSTIVFFGTPEFALPALRGLTETDYRVVGVVTRPDAPTGRRAVLTPPAVKVTAEEYGVPVFQPEKIDARDFASGKIPSADLLVVAAYGKIIPKSILDLPRYGALNIHPSLLPRWRGPSPIQHAILHGDAQTGVTIIAMDEQMDHGPVVAKRGLPLPATPRPTYPVLHDVLAKIAADLLIETLPRWIAGDIAPIPQDETRATYSKMLVRDDGKIDWSRPAEEIERMIRAFQPWPGSWTIWKSEMGNRRIRIEDADAVEDAPPAGGASGLVLQDRTRPLLVKSGRGSLVIKKLGLEGKSILDAEAFLRGHPSLIGSTLGNAN